MKRIFLLFSFLVALSGCEKDDICDANTATTPRLVISFFDINDPSVAKNVTNLGIIGEGMTDPIGLYNGVSKIEVPLNTMADLAQFNFILNSTDAAVANQDILLLAYLRSDVFVSRACGYKTVFALDDSAPVTLTDAAVADGLWIQEIEINQPAINNEDETHISIYF